MREVGRGRDEDLGENSWFDVPVEGGGAMADVATSDDRHRGVGASVAAKVARRSDIFKPWYGTENERSNAVLFW